MNLKKFLGLIIAIVFIILVIIGSTYVNNTVTKVRTLNDRLVNVNDSLKLAQYRYDSLASRYEVLEEQMSDATGKLIYVQSKLDTLTSRRIRTFTEVQAKLIELKLGLGQIPTYNPDSSSFRFE
jgi:predicted PurR-regulated permease PerM